MNPYLQDADVTIYCGHVLDVLRELPDESVHMCCTSPPFYGLRDYGTGSWEGGDPDCDHVKGKARQDNGQRTWDGGEVQSGPLYFTDTCGNCGATRVDQQIGLEPTPDEWVDALVGVFREVRRVLRVDGTCWVEIGDSYAGSWGAQSRKDPCCDGVMDWHGEHDHGISAAQIRAHPKGTRPGSIPPGASYKPKDLIGAPWLLAFALRADGWYLRSEIIWAKPNPMPESVTDRPTTSHSRVFLLAKSKSYYFDAEAIREPPVAQSVEWNKYRHPRNGDSPHAQHGTAQGEGRIQTDPVGRNRRSVWTIPTEPYPEAHFATWPTRLVEPMILAGTSERGVCPECGAPWERITDVSYTEAGKGNNNGARKGSDEGTMAARPYETRMLKSTSTVGWQPTCACYGGEPHGPTVPATVLDPFGGSGTTAHVARKHGRRTILIELNPDYCELAARRLAQQSLLA